MSSLRAGVRTSRILASASRQHPTTRCWILCWAASPAAYGFHRMAMTYGGSHPTLRRLERNPALGRSRRPSDAGVGLWRCAAASQRSRQARAGRPIGDGRAMAVAVRGWAMGHQLRSDHRADGARPAPREAEGRSPRWRWRNCANSGRCRRVPRHCRRTGQQRAWLRPRAECAAQQTRAGRGRASRSVRTPYDPPIDPANFVKKVTNPYFPLNPGTVLTYRGEDSDHQGDASPVGPAGYWASTAQSSGIPSSSMEKSRRIPTTTMPRIAQGNVWYFGEDTAEYVNGLEWSRSTVRSSPARRAPSLG